MGRASARARDIVSGAIQPESSCGFKLVAPNVMPREGGASSNHRPCDPARPCVKRRSVITGLPAFAGNDREGVPTRWLFSRWFEISQIRRRLVLLGRHQEAICAQHIVLLADFDVIVVLGAVDLAPVRPRIWLAAIALGHRPRTRQRMVEHRDFVVKDIW